MPRAVGRVSSWFSVGRALQLGTSKSKCSGDYYNRKKCEGIPAFCFLGPHLPASRGLFLRLLSPLTDTQLLGRRSG